MTEQFYWIPSKWQMELGLSKGRIKKKKKNKTSLFQTKTSPSPLPLLSLHHRNKLKHPSADFAAEAHTFWNGSAAPWREVGRKKKKKKTMR